MGRRRATSLLGLLALLATWLPGGLVPGVAAAEFTLETTAVYDVRPADGAVDVTVDITFTNTTPDPEGQFSIFPEILLAVHDDATGVTATDDDGELTVDVAVNDDGVNVATVELREGVRFEETAELQLSYTLPDGDDPHLRIRPSVIVFPAWSFGTSGEVSVRVPAGYEVRVDGDSLTDEGGSLVSGRIADPGQWLALVIATRPSELAAFQTTVPLDGGTADLEVRAFADDEAWGERTLDLVARALPLMETEIGLPYSRVGALVLAESVAADASGFGEGATTGTEIPVAYDQPPFTALHQVAHVWITPELVEARWIREGLASDVAARAAAELGVELPFDPFAEMAAADEDAFALDTWAASADPAVEAYGHAASWALVTHIRGIVTEEALRAVLARVARSIGPYESGEIEAPASGGSGALVPLTSRAFLDHLETVSGVDLAPVFADGILGEADLALLEPRAEAREAFDELVAAAGSWGTPDPVRAAMGSWSFDDAMDLMADAVGWLDRRDGLLAQMEAAGLSAPDRLQQAYRSFGGGAEADEELAAEAAVVEAYSAAISTVNAPRSILARVGLLGDPDPADRLTVANGRFADGDLRGAAEAIGEAVSILAAAETGGMIRLLSSLVVVLILVALAVLLMRRRAAYTAAP